jgi:hypothetical protein
VPSGILVRFTRPCLFFTRHQQKASIIPQIILAERNIFVCDVSVGHPLVVVGYRQFGTTTHAELYRCHLGICFQEPRRGEFRLSDSHDQILINDGIILAIGDHFVVTLGNLSCDINPNQGRSIDLISEIMERHYSNHSNGYPHDFGGIEPPPYYYQRQ